MRKKNSIALEFWYLLFTEIKGLDNGNSLWIRKQEDISLGYITKQGNSEPLK